MKTVKTVYKYNNWLLNEKCNPILFNIIKNKTGSGY